MKNKIGKNGNLLIISDLIYILTAIFIETFLVAYFLEMSNGNITKISLFYIIIFTLHGTGDLIIGRIIKKAPLKCKKVLSYGIVARALFMLFVALLSEKIVDNFILVAIIYAISEILYWCAHELIYIDVTNKNNRKKFMTNKKILGKILTIVAPILLGTSIELYSFPKIAIYIFVLSFIQIVISLLIKTNNKIDKEIKKYSFCNFIKYIKNNKLIKIKKYSYSSIAYGIIECSISTIIVIITIMTFKTSFNLGVLTTIFSSCSMISLLIYNKFYNKNNCNIILYLCASIIVIGVLGLIIDINKISLIIYNFCYTTMFCIFDVIYNVKKGDLVKECNIEDWREEYIGYCSIFICMGRIIGYFFMLIVSFSENILYLKILLAIVTIFAPVYAYLMSRIESKL